jgi:hypothetical protein
MVAVLRRRRYNFRMLSAWLFRKHLEDDETLKRVVHKHWLLGFRALFWPTLWIACTIVVLLYNNARGMITVMGLLDLVLAIWWLRNFFDYYLDAWLVTDQGIIDIAWHGWFHRESARVLYSDLQGISYEIKGVWGTLLQYGTISVEKISNGQSISMDSVRQPKQVEMMVLQSMETYLHSKNMKDAKQIQALLSSLVADQIHLHELKGSNESGA